MKKKRCDLLTMMIMVNYGNDNEYKEGVNMNQLILQWLQWDSASLRFHLYHKQPFCYLSSWRVIAQQSTQAKSRANTWTPINAQPIKIISCHLWRMNSSNCCIHPAELRPWIMLNRSVWAIRSTFAIHSDESGWQHDVGMRYVPCSGRWALMPRSNADEFMLL